MLVDAVVVLGVVGLVCYLFLRVLMSASTRGSRTDKAGPVQWRTNHYDAKGATRVVVQKVSAGGTNILDEHVVTTVPLDDPEYDAHIDGPAGDAVVRSDGPHPVVARTPRTTAPPAIFIRRRPLRLGVVVVVIMVGSF